MKGLPQASTERPNKYLEFPRSSAAAAKETRKKTTEDGRRERKVQGRRDSGRRQTGKLLKRKIFLACNLDFHVRSLLRDCHILAKRLLVVADALVRFAGITAVVVGLWKEATTRLVVRYAFTRRIRCAASKTVRHHRRNCTFTCLGLPTAGFWGKEALKESAGATCYRRS